MEQLGYSRMATAADTRSAFAGLIDAPVLTDELLSRPPFRFILDIVRSTIARTGYLRDRFPTLDPAKIREKSDKVAFLESLIQLVDDGSLSNVKPLKIVAGKEPELTNLLLVKLAEQARSFSEQNQDDPARPTRAGKEEDAKISKKRSKSKDSKEEKPKKHSRSKDDKKAKGESKDDKKAKSEEHKKKESKTEVGKQRVSKSDEPKKKEAKGGEGIKKDSKSAKSDTGHHRAKTKKTDGEEKKPSKKKLKPVDEENQLLDNAVEKQTTETLVVDEGSSVLLQEEPTTSSVGQSDMDEVSSPVKTNDSGISDMSVASPRPERAVSARPQTSMGRPGTAAARPAPPKLRRKEAAVVEPVQPSPLPISEPVIDETNIEDFLVEEVEDPVLHNHVGPAVTLLSSDQRGGLVQKMMETTAELKDSTPAANDDVDEIAFSREKQRTEAISNSLQTVARTTYPLSRIFDFAQEDFEVMILELEKWRTDAQKCENALKEREAQKADDVQNLTTVLSSLDEDLNGIRAQVRAAKSRVASTEQRIQQLLMNL